MSKNKLITHLINEDRESFNKDSLDILTEGKWTDRLKSMVNTKTLGKILSPRKKGNILDDLVNSASDKIDERIGALIDYLGMNSVEKTVRNLNKKLQDLEKQSTRLANDIFKKSGRNPEALLNNAELRGIIDQIVVIKSEISMLSPYVRSSESSKEIASKLKQVSDSDTSSKTKTKEARLLAEIVELEMRVRAAQSPVKENLQRQIRVKYQEYNNLKGYAGMTPANAGGMTGGANEPAK